MESRIRTGSGFWIQGAVKRKFPNGNLDVTDWFRSCGNPNKQDVGLEC